MYIKDDFCVIKYQFMSFIIIVKFLNQCKHQIDTL